MDKTELRKKYKQIRAAVPRGQRLVKSGIIAEKLFNLQCYADCGSVFVYSDANTEVSTALIINRAIDDGKITAVPKMLENNNMVFLEISSLYELTEVKYGIAEPVYDSGRIVAADKNTLIIVPMLAFDKDMNRLGYGGGYYDRYLAANEYMAAVGIAFCEQKADILPVEKFDIKLDYIITDK